MSIVALGLNHTTAPLELRERAVVDDAGMPSALRSLSSIPGVSEAAILSTCNRTDLYCGIGVGEDAPTRWFGEFLGIDRRDLAGHLYVHREDAAVRHLMRVASGLDSMVLGEPQILGQLKHAYGTARRAGSLGVVLEKLFQRSFSVAKRVRTDTDIGASPVSVAYAAVTLAHRIFGDLDARTALLVGAGETVRALRAPPRIEPRRTHGDREPHRRACPPHRDGAGCVRHLPRRSAAPSRRGGHRDLVHRQPRDRHLVPADARRAPTAPAAADVHGRPRGSARHRPRGRYPPRRVPVRRRRPRGRDRGGPAAAHRGGGRGRRHHRPAGLGVHGLDAGAARVLGHRRGAGVRRRREGRRAREGPPPAAGRRAAGRGRRIRRSHPHQQAAPCAERRHPRSGGERPPRHRRGGENAVRRHRGGGDPGPGPDSDRAR